jgi:hypothetical protein
MAHVTQDDRLAAELKLMAMWLDGHGRNNRLLESFVMARMRFSKAKAIAANSPGPKSRDNHSEGVARGSTTSSQGYRWGEGTSNPRR